MAANRNFAEKGSLFTVSGLDTEQTPASIEWIVTTNGDYTPEGGLAGNYAITNGNNCLPYIICAYSSHLEIAVGRMVNLIPQIIKISSNIYIYEYRLSLF